jgi:hypothetical protein
MSKAHENWVQTLAWTHTILVRSVTLFPICGTQILHILLTDRNLMSNLLSLLCSMQRNLLNISATCSTETQANVETTENVISATTVANSNNVFPSGSETVDIDNGSSDEHWTNVLNLTREELTILQNNSICLNDRIINAAQKLLKERNNWYDGLHDTVVVAAGQVSITGRRDVPFVQIVHDEPYSHWMVVTNINCNVGELSVYCSLHQIPSAQCQVVITRYLKMEGKSLKLNVVNVARQIGVKDCGLFAVAYAESLVRGQDPINVFYNQNVMRAHLLNCFLSGKISAFPTLSFRTTRKRVIRSLDVDLFCICRASNATDKPMIQCDGCYEWFHPECVGIHDATFESLLDPNKPYTCEVCHKGISSSTVNS